MKKFLKIFLILIVLILVILVFNTIRNVYIINKIRDNENQYFSDLTTYKMKIESHSAYTTESNGNTLTKETRLDEIYYKDNTCLVKNYIDGQLSQTNKKDNDKVSDSTDVPTYAEILKFDTIKDVEFNSIKLYLLSFIRTDGNNYVLKGIERDFYYDKDTGLLSKFYDSEDRYEIYTIEKNTVTDSDMVEENIDV